MSTLARPVPVRSCLRKSPDVIPFMRYCDDKLGGVPAGTGYQYGYVQMTERVWGNTCWSVAGEPCTVVRVNWCIVR